ncbi:hypothetical protein F0342_24320 [Bacillus sp. CH30_1T]|uniref:DUF6366 family protein n=1 Tax=Bacillaceae TaxID=186817 RepID=UPI0011EF957B|nr:DUF6366 family protein [Bacillus sp. CH30_1T]KAA0560086.1 hypothetical protein F0342_24320 [Bacillus sp. CH30_1T]
MENNKENPEHKREKLRQEEFKKNPMGDMNNHSNLADLVGSLGWKGTGILILLIIIGSIIFLLVAQ